MNAGTSINAAIFTPDGSQLVCGTALGKLHLWHFTEAADSDESGGLAPSQPATLQAHAHGCAIYALVFAETSAGLLLLSGADEEIRGWRWDAVLKASKSPDGAMPPPVLRFENPRTALRRGALGQLSETSALAFDAASGRLYSAAGDGNAYSWDLQAAKCVSTYEGAGEPLHCLTLCRKRQQLVTGGEDGAVRLWDVRSAACAHVITPASLAATSGQGSSSSGGGGAGSNGAAGGGGGGGSGGWCGCVAVDEGETWLVAGWGDGFLCSVDLNTRACVACMPTAAAPLAVSFEPHSDFHIVSVGAENGLYHWRLTGELETRGTCSSPAALGLAITTAPGGTQPMFAVGGSHGTVDIFTDTSHRAFTLCLPEAEN